MEVTHSLKPFYIIRFVSKRKWLGGTPTKGSVAMQRDNKSPKKIKTEMSEKWRFEGKINVSAPFPPVFKLPRSVHKAAINDIHFKGVKELDEAEDTHDRVAEGELKTETLAVVAAKDTEEIKESLDMLETDLSPSSVMTKDKKYKCSFCTKFYATLLAIKAGGYILAIPGRVYLVAL